MIGYIYKITNLVNQKIYIGKHKSDDFDDGYWGSGKLIWLAYNKYGKANFKREVISWAETMDELNQQEIYWIQWYRENNYTLYNLSGGGYGGLGLEPWNKGKKISEETREKISNSLKGKIRSKEHCKNLSESLTGREFSEEHKKHLSESMQGRVPWIKGKHGFTAWNKGKKMSEESRKKMSKSMKGRTPWNKGKKMSKECRRKLKEIWEKRRQKKK